MNEQSTTAPAPSKHVFVHELSKHVTGAKVRFLCCVLEYDVMKGHLLVEHAYPTDTEPTPKALIDVNIILGTIKGAMLETGSWINVIGYVKGRQQTQKVTTGKSLEANLPRMSGEVLVQAVLVWDAGAMQINEYEKTMEAQREAWRKMKHVHDATRVGRSL